MQDVEIRTEQLRTILKENRAAHEAAYKEALPGYLAECKEKMEEAHRELMGRITQVIKGQQDPDLSHIYLNVDPLSCHLEDYDRAILMAELETRDTLKLSMREFAQYVQDQWDWKEAFIGTSAAYVRKAKALK